MDRLVRGKRIYDHRVLMRESWQKIGKKFGLSDRGSLGLAREYASSCGKPWPVERATKGGAIYSSRSCGISWLTLSRCYGENVGTLRRQAYKYAKRRGLTWPAREQH